SVEDVNHLLERLTLRGETPAGCNLADVAIVRRARSLVVQEDAGSAPPRPRLEIDRVQIRHVERADDLEPLRTDPSGVGRVVLGADRRRLSAPRSREGAGI